MRLSTSSSNDRLPTGRWGITWLCALFVAATAISVFEMGLRYSGFQPTQDDSVEFWIEQRDRINDSSERPVVLLGSSRIQLGVDTAYLRDELVRPVIQLAIDGTSFMPLLEDLSEDESFVGDVVVSVVESHVLPSEENQRASEWVDAYYKYKNKGIEPYKYFDQLIELQLRSRLSSRFMGVSPIDMTDKWNPALTSTPKVYLTTNTDRSRNADYSLLDQVQTYIGRVLRHYSLTFPQGVNNFEAFDRYCLDKLSERSKADLSLFEEGVQKMDRHIKEIEERGGRVYLVRFPTDKLIWAFDDHVWPKGEYWDTYIGSRYNSVHFRDYPEMARFSLPDGSHLDMRDKKPFTKALLEALSDKGFEIE
ncbi:hypothetical protein HCH_04166 [Hahella chejuensis KCTC 2396]|uniref:Uncharacterized protein n=1 Tax=Hahella chejuensis (strain KCTC 2396) TaxID=349521 RepID=Q2SEQ1_HAHCH|nr:hypothetical protein [Hahella chejuensis]ABC30873.1 hypothetical protein HCH_04166 [Hahella chejuensis KCTC 2396]